MSRMQYYHILLKLISYYTSLQNGIIKIAIKQKRKYIKR